MGCCLYGEKYMNKRNVRGNQYRRNALTAALAVSLGLTGVAYGQATTGSIFGTAPTQAGETVKAVNNQTGFTREVPVDSSGHYSVTNLPIGDNYTVSLINNGQVVASQDHVQVSVNGGAQVPFAAATSGKNVENLSGVTVTANAIPAIDVSSTRQTSVITAADLKVLPVARSAESIALLAPGTAFGAGALGEGPAGTPLVSFGGNSVVENAYYINGFNTTDPVGNAGGIALPYFAIAEQQTITSGYGAEYGRSTGGVISQVGKRGGNEFHAGAYVAWEPSWAQGDYDNVRYSNPRVTTAGQQYGDLYENKKRDASTSQIYDAYVSGPLIKDKLFFFIAAEAQHDSTKLTDPGDYNSRAQTSPKFYGKLDWNINDNNILELTGIQTKINDTTNNAYAYDPYTDTKGDFTNVNNPLYSNKFKIGILKYTSYITDDLTLSVLYGKMRSTYYSQTEGYPGFDPTLAGIVGGCATGTQSQDPKIPGYGNCNNNATSVPNPGHTSRQANFRLDLDWKLGDHDLKFGIDNVRSTDDGDGTVTAGPGYRWQYSQAPSTDPTKPLLTNPAGDYVDSPWGYGGSGADGYVARKTVYGGVSTFTVIQRAQYIEDNWQVTPNLLLNLGLRNDQFANYNAVMEPYAKETSPQWAPRLGFSWDIFGDSSAKLYGNVGRYYLALPSGLGVRTAGANSYVDSYFTYTSIDANGIPQGLTPIPASRTPFSADGEYGTPKDPKTVTATDLKPEFQDEYVLGFQKLLGDTGIVWTSQATYSKMKNVVDDTGAIIAPDGSVQDILVNPGRTNTIRYQTADGSYDTFKWNPATAQGTVLNGFPKAVRKYYSLEESLEHPWDGKWMAKVDYLFSKSYGTTEGPTESATGQISNASGFSGGGQSASITEAWDFPELMQYANGELPNSHRHTLKAYGTYAITPEWLLSGLYIVQSGAPLTCLGYYGPDEQDVIGYAQGAGAYHWCGGKPSAPGDAGHTPWTHQLNLSVDYIPEWASKHLDLQVQVHNVFNEQKITQYDTFYGSTSAPYPSWKLPLGIEAPRYVEFSVKYDW
jgi:hypothetical protein